jgi:hypothetical protein
MRLPEGVWLFVAVTVVATGASGESSGKTNGDLPDSAEMRVTVPSFPIAAAVLIEKRGDTERADAISIIEQLSKRMNAIE